MDSKKIFLFIFCIYILLYSVHAVVLKKTVYGDGEYYFSWVRSLAVNRDINFSNEYRNFHINQEYTPTSLMANKYSVGPALFWYPFYKILHNIRDGYGYELSYQYLVGLISTLFALTGIILLYRLLTSFVTDNIALLATISITFATHLVFYGAIDTVNSHALDFFAVVLYLTFLFQKQIHWYLVGFTLGLIGLFRAQDLTYGILILPFLLKNNITSVLPNTGKLIFGISLGFLPQLIAWQILYGQFLTSPYFLAGEGFSLFNLHILEVLFSVKNGLLLYTPIIPLGLVGLMFRNHRMRLPIVVLFLLQLLIVSSWSSWNQGASFSGRMFVSILPVIAIGLAFLYKHLEQHGWNSKLFFWMIIFPLTSINAILILYFLSTTS